MYLSNGMKLLQGALISVALLCAVSAQGQSGIDIRTGIMTGQWNPYKIAVDDFKIAGDSSVGADTMAAKVKKVIVDDLDFHVFFDTVTAKQFYLNVWEIEEITPLVWYRMGAEYLVSGSVEVKGSELKVDYLIRELFQDGSTNELKSATFRTDAGSYRRLAHMIADRVVEHVAAERPFFTTRLVYISKATGSEEVCVCDYDGANPVRLTADNSLNISPCWDSRGDKVLFTSYRRGKQQLWEHDVGSGKEKLIANYELSNLDAAVSPDNKEILLSLSKDGNAELYVLDREGKTKRRLTRIPSIEVGASWSPTGNLIAFQSDRSGSPQIYLMDSEGLNVQRLTFEGVTNDSPDFSPLGTSIAFVTRGANGDFQVSTIDVTGENFRVLEQNGSNENPHWAPDGWHLVYSKQVGSDKDLYIMDRFGNKRRRVTFDGESFSPAWQPSGSRGGDK